MKAKASKLVISRETLRLMTPKEGKIGFECSTVDREEMLNVFATFVSRGEDLEIIGK